MRMLDLNSYDTLQAIVFTCYTPAAMDNNVSKFVFQLTNYLNFYRNNEYGCGET